MNKIVFSFLRMNPPTKGHEKLINKVRALAGSEAHLIFLSHTQNCLTDPFNWEYKLNLAKIAFTGANFCENSEIKTPFQALEHIVFVEDYKDITLVVGEDRVEDFKERMTPYALAWGIDKFEIVSAGERDRKYRGIKGLSGSKMRQYANLGKASSFYAGLPSTIDDGMKKQIFEDIQHVMKVDKNAAIQHIYDK